jgi:hypothetical protein
MNVVAIAAKTGAKTSRIVRWMKFYPGVGSVSFGEYLRQKNTEQADLQDFGQRFLEQHGAAELVRGVLATQTQSQVQCLIIDGLRHPQVWEVLAKQFPDCSLLCVAPSEDVLVKSLTDSGLSTEEARKRIQHPVEQGLDQLVTSADYVTRGNTVLETEEHAVRTLVAAVDPAIVPEPIQEEMVADTESHQPTRLRRRELLKKDALSRGRRAVFNLLFQEGGCISEPEVAKLLRLSRPNLRQSLERGEFFAVMMNGELQFPVWQFAGGKTLPGLKTVLATLRDYNDLAKLRFFLAGNLLLSGRSPLDMLRAGCTKDALRAARAYLRHGAV